MNFKHIIFLGCSFTQMKTFYYDHEKERYKDVWFAEPDWTKLVAEWTGLRHKNVGESGKSNASLLRQYLTAKATLPPKDPCIVIAGLTVTTRMTYRGYAGITTFRGDSHNEDAIGNKQWENTVIDDGFVWQNLIELGDLSETCTELGDQFFAFGNHCELTAPTFTESLNNYLDKNVHNIEWGQPDINLRQTARSGLEVFADRMLNKIPPEFQPIKDKMDANYPMTPELKHKLKRTCNIISRYSKIEDWHLQNMLENGIGDPGLNFNSFTSYFEQPDSNQYLKITTDDGHPNQTGSNLLAEYVYYNLTQHELLKNAGFDPFIGTRYLRFI